MDQTLLDLLYAVGGIVLALLGNFVWGKLKERPDYTQIEEMARRIVEAAQQQWGTDNQTKYDYAVTLLSNWLKSKGWNISEDLIKVFIESAVRLLKREEQFLLINEDVEDDEVPF